MNQAYQYREHFLHQNFRKLLHKYPNDKFLAQLGQIHAVGRPVDKFIKLENWESLSVRLKADGYALATLSFWYAHSHGHLDKEILGEGVYQLISEERINSNAMLFFSQNDTLLNFDGIFYNNFKQREADPAEKPQE